MKGGNLGKWHGRGRAKPVEPISRSKNGKCSPRFSSSFDEADLKIIAQIAKARGKPVAQVMRDAVACYVMPFRNNPTWDVKAKLKEAGKL